MIIIVTYIFYAKSLMNNEHRKLADELEILVINVNDICLQQYM